jgi:hypothetical protein
MSLRESLQLLQITGNSFNGKTARQAVAFDNPSLPQLTELLERMNTVSVARKVFCPEEYLKYWSKFQKQIITEIPPRVRRFLCWEPSIGANFEFLTFLKQMNEAPSANSLQGLVYARHSKWSSDNTQAKELALVRLAVMKYQGRNRLINKWRENIDLILNPQSTKIAAKKIFSAQQSVSAFCGDWGINEQTSFISETVAECARLCFKQFAGININDDAGDYFISKILDWENFELNVYKAIISQTIMTGKFLKDEKFQEKVVQHIIADNRLGDPRLPINSQNWVGVETEARTRILQLLSRADIVFFFDQVMTGYDDRHGRKNFWLRYITSLKQSRPLLNGSDKLRLYSTLRRQGKKMLHFGETRGQQSAFLLDFGAILVIEFNGVGACYIYEELSRKRLFHDIYTDEPFTDGKLKQPYAAAERVSHRGDWQWRLGYILSHYGIRPN